MQKSRITAYGAALFIVFSSLSATPAQTFSTFSEERASDALLSTDLTPVFMDHMTSPRELKKEELRQYRIIFASGLKSDLMRRMAGDFSDQMNTLKKAGLKSGEDFVLLASREGFNGFQNITTNARAIATAIADSDRPVLLVSQSKASVDVLDALISNPALLPKVKGWFSIQGAFGGSVLADNIEADERSRTRFHRMISMMGGDPECLTELQRSVRSEYMMKHAESIAAIIQSTRMISFASHKRHEDLYWPLKRLNNTYNPDHASTLNDGVIAVEDALLPSASHITVEGVDHADSTLKIRGEFHRGNFMKAIVGILLER